MKKMISILCSLTIITGGCVAFCANAADATAESTETPDKTPVGTTHLTYSGTDEDISLDGEMIYADGQYDMTWNVAGSGINEANNISLTIENIHPNPLGIKEEVELKIDEIWVDGEKLDVTLHGKPAYAIMTDNIYTSDEIVRYIYALRQTYINNSDASFNDLDTTIDDEIRIVFTMNGLIDPETYRDEHPGREPMPGPPSVSSTTTTTTTTTTEATTEAVVTTTTAAVKTTTKNSGNNPPKTGDAGAAGILLAGAGAAAMAFVLRKQKD